MDRQDIFNNISEERNRQDAKWGSDFDNLNTPNDWIAYITQYAGKAVTIPWDAETFRSSILKVATICVAALERDTYSPRHYDRQEELVVPKDDIYERVKEVVENVAGIDVVNPDTPLEDLGADSLDLIEIVMELEETFGIDLPDEEAEKATSTAAITALVKSKLPKGNSR